MQPIKKIIVGLLLLESRLILARYKPYVIAVTGSVGKTSTKDAIYEALTSADHAGAFSFVRKSEKSLNSEIGLPLTLIGVPNAWRRPSGWLSNLGTGLWLILKRQPYPDCLVLEVGADHPGDIRRVAKWLRPHIAVMTKISDTPVHVEFFGSPQAVFEEKASLASSVRSGGALVVYGDDENLEDMADRVKGNDVSVVSYGLIEKATVKGANVAVKLDSDGKPAGMSFVLEMDGERADVSVSGVMGRSYAYPLLAAAAVGKVRGMKASQVAGPLSGYKAPRGRMNVLSGVNGSTLIDDTYNSSPDAASAALEALRSIGSSGARIAVLGDMMELGQFSTEEHRRIGREAAASATRLFTAGQRSRQTAEEAIKAGMPAESVKAFDSAAEAAEALKSTVSPGDVVLIKGSQSMRMERVTKALLARPEAAGELLVRQEKEWLEKA